MEVQEFLKTENYLSSEEVAALPEEQKDYLREVMIKLAEQWNVGLHPQLMHRIEDPETASQVTAVDTGSLYGSTLQGEPSAPHPFRPFVNTFGSRQV